MVFEGQSIPISFRTRDDSRKLIKLFITRDAFELFFGQQCILLVLFILGNHKDDLFDLRLEEEKRFFDLKLVTFEIDHLVDLNNTVIHGPYVLVVVGLIDLSF